ncbi:MAG: hypothetical protein AAF481_06490 [Acidobacteriota bacterium]
MTRNTNAPKTLQTLLHFIAALLLATAVHAVGGVTSNPGDDPMSTRYAALWTASPGEARIASEETLTAFDLENAAFEQQGFRLVDFETIGFGDERLYVGLWHEVPGDARPVENASLLVVDYPFDGIAGVISNHSATGYQLVDIEVYSMSGNLMVAAVFHPGDAPPRYGVGLSAQELYEAKWYNESQGRRQVDIEEYYDASGKRYFAAIWAQGVESSPETTLGVGLPWQGILDLSAGMTCGRHLTDLELMPGRDAEQDEWTAAGLWTAPAVAESVLFPATWEEVEARLDAPFPGPVPPASEGGLLIDLEILWHYAGEIESSLGADHDGPLIPNAQPSEGS